MLSRGWKPLGAAVALVVPASAYYYYSFREPLPRDTFDLAVRVKGPDGKREKVMKSFPLLSQNHINTVLRDSEFAASYKHWRWTVSRLASNSPIEDAHASNVVQRDASDPSAPGEFMFFSVFDGHSGTHTSKLLSRVLHNAVVLNLIPLTQRPPGLRNYFSKTGDSDPTQVSSAIQKSFRDLDFNLISGPLQALVAHATEDTRKNNSFPDLSKNPLARKLVEPALSGACALMALFDTAKKNLYVACTGDCRAVAGYWQDDGKGSGSWRVEVLTQDQTGRNPDELKRMQLEHPGEEDTVIMNGRVLGGLEPTRAFGDARYKWEYTKEGYGRLHDAFYGKDELSPLQRGPPKLSKTPPYVTAEPVVTHIPLKLPGEGNKESLQFLIMATDGLWDRLSSEEVVSLVAGHLSGVKGTITHSELNKVVPTTQGSSTVEGKDIVRNVNPEKTWVFEDENLSTHLIRNAMGGADEMNFRRLLSIPAPFSRSYRDDVTVQCIWWDKSLVSEDDAIKAKL